MIRTGIYGGTFNPIHVGHTQLGASLVEQGLVDELWYMVSPQNPFKVNQHLLDDEARLHMARLAIPQDSKLSVSDFEFGLPRPSYMIHTLQALVSTYPRRTFTLVIGADNWERFPQWYRAQDILQSFPLIVIPRPGFSTLHLPPTVQLSATPLMDVSSTRIREQIRQGTYDGSELHPAVWQEIQAHQYYK